MANDNEGRIEDDILANPIFAEQEMGDEAVNTTVDGIPIPGRYEPGWKDYVLSQFLDSEMEGGNPKIAGLRRVTEKIVGRVIGCKSKIYQTPHIDNGLRATIVHTIKIFDKEVGQLSFEGAADAAMSNIDDKMFQRYPVAMAETRAASRAYRNALGLYDVCAAEEIDNNPAITSEFKNAPTGSEDSISETQVNLMNIICGTPPRGLDIDVDAFARKEIPTVKRMRQVSCEDAKVLLKKLSSYQNDVTLVPDDIKGFDKNWRL